MYLNDMTGFFLRKPDETDEEPDDVSEYPPT
jgi:hypothetical protein